MFIDKHVIFGDNKNSARARELLAHALLKQ